jgi:hypothetical protein
VIPLSGGHCIMIKTLEDILINEILYYDKTLEDILINEIFNLFHPILFITVLIVKLIFWPQMST